MSLLPQNDVERLDAYLEAEASTEVEPSYTYRIDFNENRIGNMADGADALKQAIVKSILTPRSYYPIYNDNYGCEIWDLIGANVTQAYIESEIPRMVTEAIIYDDRINTVTNITVTRRGDAIFINVEVDSIFGEIETEVTI